jgi:2-oxo-4-hydroxy-4-carboxy-5-ureidoimidazoline decarboxylase
MIELAELNEMALPEFVERLGAVFEHSPWVAQRAFSDRPFSTVEELHRAMTAAVRNASPDEQLALVRAHPELAGAEAKEGTLTVDSSSEQARLGFNRLSRDEFAKMAELNRSYRQKFGFPCIVALRLHATRDSVIAEMQRRLSNEGETEMNNALEQIAHITRGRLARILAER